jgi:N6-adenosine-specific RNA methylase IME4
MFIDDAELEREYHPAAQLLPMMEGDDYAAFRDDINAHGLLEPIWLSEDGRILDGRNRHRACLDLGIAPVFRTYTGDSPTAFALSLNAHRRHLTASQRAVLAVAALPGLEADAKARQSHGRTAPGRTLPAILPEAFPDGGEAREQAAAIVGASARYVSDAKRLAAEAPDLLESVRVGGMTIPQAKRELVARERRDAPPLPTDKYRVLYADPPWSYGNSGIIGDTDHYGRVGRHYPSMTIAELCALPIRDMVEDNAVLFMWVTSPLLAECFEVIRAWGFTYKTSFVWDKVRHNFGHYNSVRHELLLVCTRGSCTPDAPTLYDSVQTIERSDVHSEKPEAFREIIDALYPHGRRLELFARRDAAGWETWGNE